MMQKSIPTAEQVTPALSITTTHTVSEPICKYPGRSSCLGCECSFAPDLYDGGCLAAYTPEERQAIRDRNPLPARRV